MVAAGQLTQPLDRPQGLQSVTNPSAATGGADPATSGSSPRSPRRCRPSRWAAWFRSRTIRTSHSTSPGIALALATWTWFGALAASFSPSPAQAAQFSTQTTRWCRICKRRFETYGLPYVPVLDRLYTPVLVRDHACRSWSTRPPTSRRWCCRRSGRILPRPSLSATAARPRGRGQPDHRSSRQQVPGVIAVNLTAFNRSGESRRR